MSDVRRTVEALSAAGIAALMTIGYIIFVGRALGPVEYAEFSAALSLIYLGAVALTPVTPTLARIVSGMATRGDEAGIAGLRTDVMRRAPIVLGALTVLGAALSPFLARALKFQSPLTFSLSIAAAALFALLSIDRGVLQGLMHFRMYNGNVLIESCARLLGAIILFALFGRSTNAALVSYVIAIAVAESVLALGLRQRLGTGEAIPADWNRILALALPMFGLMLCLAVFQNADMLVVKRSLAPPWSGYYGAATALAKGFGVLFVPLYVLLGPTLSALHESRRPLLGTVLRYEAWFLAISIGPLLLCLLFPEAILGPLYGPAFRGAAPLLFPLAGLSVITHSALMLVQLLITVHDFRFLVVYAAGVVAQIAALAIFHRSWTEIVTALYVCQSLVLAAVVAMIVLHHAETRHDREA